MWDYLRLMRFHKPVGIFLLLWPALWGLWLASSGKPNLFIVSIFILGVIVTRSAGCVMNDLIDQRIDGHITRTKERPLITGKISRRAAFILFSILMSIALGLVSLCNRLTVELAFLALFLMLIYPFMKRVTSLPQVILGWAFAFSVPMAFAATTNHVPLNGWIVFLIASLWPIIYDTQYAMADYADDIKIGVKSTAILFGRWNRLILSVLQMVFLGLLFLIGHLFHLHFLYDVSLLVVAMFFIYQQGLMKNRDPQKWFQAFLNHGWVGLIIFVGMIGGFS